MKYQRQTSAHLKISFWCILNSLRNFQSWELLTECHTRYSVRMVLLNFLLLLFATIGFTMLCFPVCLPLLPFAFKFTKFDPFCLALLYFSLTLLRLVSFWFDLHQLNLIALLITAFLCLCVLPFTSIWLAICLKWFSFLFTASWCLALLLRL